MRLITSILIAYKRPKEQIAKTSVYRFKKTANRVISTYRDTYNLNFTHSKYVDLLQHVGQYCSINTQKLNYFYAFSSIFSKLKVSFLNSKYFSEISEILELKYLCPRGNALKKYFNFSIIVKKNEISYLCWLYLRILIFINNKVEAIISVSQDQRSGLYTKILFKFLFNQD